MTHNDARRTAAALPPPVIRCPPTSAATVVATTMDPAAWRRVCAAFRAKLSQDTGTNLTASVCERLLGTTFRRRGGSGGGGGAASLQSNPGLFYTSLGDAIEEQTLALDLPNRLKLAWWCFREAAEVHKHPVGMGRLGNCLYHGVGVTAAGADTRSLLSSASARFHGIIGGARRDCVARVEGVLGGVHGV